MDDLISPRQYTDMKCDALEKLILQALESARLAVSKAESASERRFEGVNEFRNALGDSARLMMPRIEAEKQWLAVNEKIDLLGTRLNAQREDFARLVSPLMPRAETEKEINTLSDKLEVLVSRMDARDERGRGMTTGWATLVSVVSVVASLIAIAVVIIRTA